MEALTLFNVPQVSGVQRSPSSTSVSPARTEQLKQTLTGERSKPAGEAELKSSQTRVDSMIGSGSKSAPKSPLAPPALVKSEAKPAEAEATPAKPFNPMAMLSNPKAMMQSAVDWGKSLEKKAREQHTQRHTAIDEAKAEETPSGTSKFDPAKDTTTLYSATKGQVFTDSKAVKELYWDRSKKQIDAMEMSYSDRFGRAATEDLKELDSRDSKIVDALRKGDRVGAATLQMIDGGRHNNQDLLEDTLRKLNPEERQKLSQSFKGPKGENLEAMLKDKLKGERGEEALALLRGDEAAANLSQLRQNFSKDKDGEVMAQLRAIEPGKEKEFVDSFNQKVGSLTAEINRRLHGDERAEALALVSGNRAAADAARIHSRQWGDEKANLWSSLGEDIKDPQERKAYLAKVESEFNDKYSQGDSRSRFQSFINKDLNREDKDKFNSILTQGEIPPDKQLVHALSGDKKDGNEVAALVKRLGPEQARLAYQEATKDAKNPNGRNLEDDIKGRLGGNERFEAEQSLKGAPKDAAEMVARAQDRAKFENGGIGFFTDADEIMNKNVGRAEEALKSMEFARSQGDQEGVHFYERRVAELTGYSLEDAEMYKGEKEGAGEIAAAVVTTAAAVGVTVATGGTAAPFLAAAVGAAAGAATNVGTKAVFQGGGYDWHKEGASDAFTGAVLGATGGIGAVEGAALKAGAQKAIGQVTGSKLAGQTVGAVTDGVVSNALSSAAGSTVLTVADGSTWSNGLASGMGRLAGAVTGETLGGAATGGLISPGQDAALGTMMKTLSKKVDIDGPPVRPSSGAEELRAAPMSAEPVAPVAVKIRDSAEPVAKLSKPLEGFTPDEVTAIRLRANEKALADIEDLHKYGNTDHMGKMVDLHPELQAAVDSGKYSVEEAYAKIVESKYIKDQLKVRAKTMTEEAVQSGRITQREADMLPSTDPLMGRLSRPFMDELRYTSDSAGVTGLGKLDDGDLRLLTSSRVANRVLEPDAPRTADGVTTVYGAQHPRDLAVVEEARAMLGRGGSSLASHLEEVHFSTVIHREAGKERTAGRMFGGDSVAKADSAVDIRRPRATETLKGASGEEVRVSALADQESVRYTIVHETVHLHDKQKGWVSDRPDSVFGKGDDFVTDYARTNANEDYAETGAFLISMNNGTPIPDSNGVKLTPGLKEKLAASAESIGLKDGSLEHTIAALELENRVVGDFQKALSGQRVENLNTALAFMGSDSLEVPMRRSPGDLSASEQWSRAQQYGALAKMSAEDVAAQGYRGTPDQYRELSDIYSAQFDASVRQDVRAATSFVRRFQQGVDDGPHGFQKIDNTVVRRVGIAAQELGVSQSEANRMSLYLKYAGQADSLGSEAGLKSAQEYREFGNFFRIPPQDVAGWSRFDELSQRVFPEMTAEGRRALLTTAG